MKRIFIALFFLLLAGYASAACGVLNSDYNLTASEVAVGRCFTINASNIVLTCGAYNITGDGTGEAVFNKGFTNVSIKDCEIRNFATGIYFTSGANYANLINLTLSNYSNAGIYLNMSNNASAYFIYANSTGYGLLTNNVNYSLIANSTIKTSAVYGIYLFNSSNNAIINSTGAANNFGIALVASSNNSIINSTGAAITFYGIYLYSNSNNNQVANSSGIAGNSLGIIIQSSSNNLIVGSTGTAVNYGISFFTSANNNQVVNSTGTATNYGLAFYTGSNNNQVINSSIRATLYDIYSELGVSGNALVNSTFNRSNIGWGSGKNDIAVKFYVNFSVANYSGVGIGNANVNATPFIGGQSLFNGTTDSNGFITGLTALAEFIANGSFVYNASSQQNYTILNNWTFFAEAALYNKNSTGAAITENRMITIILEKTYINYSKICSGIGWNITLNGSAYISGRCITINASNIVIDCAGFSIKGNGTSEAVFNKGFANVSIKNCNISNFTTPIYFTSGANYASLYNLTLSNYSNAGIYLNMSNNASAYFIYANSTPNAIWLNGVNNSIIANSTVKTISAGKFGIFISTGSNYNQIANSTATADSYGIYLFSCANTQIINSTAIAITQVGIGLASSSNNVIINTFGIATTNYGLYISAGANNTLINFTGRAAVYGIYVSASANNSIINSTGNSSTTHGIYLHTCTSNLILNSTGIVKTNYGIYLNAGGNNSIINSSGRATNYGIYFSASTNNRVINSSFRASALYDIFTTVGASNNTFINSTFNRAKIGWGTGSNNLTVGWLVNFSVVNYNGTGIKGAAVNATPMQGGEVRFNGTTDGNGSIAYLTEIIEFTANGSFAYTGANTTGLNFTGFNNWTFYGSKSKYIANFTLAAITESQQITIILELAPFVSDEDMVYAVGAAELIIDILLILLLVKRRKHLQVEAAPVPV